MACNGVHPILVHDVVVHIRNKTPAMHRDIFRLQLANDRHMMENLPPH